ncbi:hypothetical protein BaRGS_00026244, partial [Batillaria attramentaria]
MGDSKQPPSISSSKADLLPEMITFTEGGKWMRRTGLEKCLIVTAVLLFAVAATFVALFAVLYVQKHNSTTDASFLSESIDSTVNPCDDFYRFACGKWIDSHPIPTDSSSIQNFKLIADDVQDLLKELLMDDDATSPQGIQQARSFFRSCEDTDRMDKRGAAPLLDMFKTADPNIYPTLNPTWVDEGWNLTEIVYRVGSVGGISSVNIMAWFVSADEKNSTWNIITFTQPRILLPSRNMYLQERNSSVLALYESVYTKVHVLLGADEATARQDAKDVVDLEIQLVNATEPRERRRESERLYNKMTIKDMMERYPDVDWLRVIQKEFTPAGVTVTEDEPLVNKGLTYYDQLFAILRRTPRRTILNYCMWKITYSLSTLLHKEIRDVLQQFHRTDSTFPDAVGRLYVERKFPPEAKQRIEHMITNLRAAFREMVIESEWMTNKTKQAALDKLEFVKYKLGYPDYLMNDTALNSKTKEFNISEALFFESNIRHHDQKNIEAMQKLRKPVDRDEWLVSADTVNAFYDPVKNEMVFPAGILNKPFFSEQFLDALNYGGVGMVIGHELTHGFDDQGRTYDKLGNLQAWWQDEDVKRFNEKKKCMVQQYSQFEYPGLNINVNGELTIGEDIADNGGLKEAFMAYRKAIAKRGKEEAKLPVLPYTPDQLFFIGFSQFWCSNDRDRVMGPLRNSEDFSRAFNCPRGSPMNPEKK